MFRLFLRSNPASAPTAHSHPRTASAAHGSKSRHRRPRTGSDTGCYRKLLIHMIPRRACIHNEPCEATLHPAAVIPCTPEVRSPLQSEQRSPQTHRQTHTGSLSGPPPSNALTGASNSSASVSWEYPFFFRSIITFQDILSSTSAKPSRKPLHPTRMC